jgi:hypothetical protein
VLCWVSTGDVAAFSSVVWYQGDVRIRSNARFESVYLLGHEMEARLRAIRPEFVWEGSVTVTVTHAGRLPGLNWWRAGRPGCVSTGAVASVRR